MKFWHHLWLIGTLAVALLSFVALAAWLVVGDGPANGTVPPPAAAGAHPTTATTGL